MREIKQGISACLVTTALALLCLSIIALFYQGTMICISTVFQTLGVSMVIHFLLWLLKKWESEYIIVEIICQNAIVIGVVLLAGFIFGWFQNLPTSVLTIMAVIVYLLSCVLETTHLSNEIKKINKMVGEIKRG
ncbi:MAG: DUF3021 family protein [Cellulosilyticum sp.]|nr:DUF3021 family protein [Cellulosilyticum sp.]